MSSGHYLRSYKKFGMKWYILHFAIFCYSLTIFNDLLRGNNTEILYTLWEIWQEIHVNIQKSWNLKSCKTRLTLHILTFIHKCFSYNSNHRDGSKPPTKYTIPWQAMGWGGIFTPSDMSICLYRDHTMAFILAIMPLHFLSLYNIYLAA